MDTKIHTQRTTFHAHIEGLRALAVIGVLIFHVNRDWLPGGLLGVDIFYVISGFLITQIIIKNCQDNTFSLSTFYVRRARRILPAAFATLFLTLLVSLFILGPLHFAAAAQSAVYSVFSLANIHFWMTAGYFDIDTHTKPFLHFWSLGTEEQYYLFWPVLFLLFPISSKHRSLIFFVTFLIVISLAAQLYFAKDHSEAVFYLMPFRVWELATGAMIALIGLPRSKRMMVQSLPLSHLLTLAGLLAILASYIFHPIRTSSTVFQILAVLGTVLILIGQKNPVSTLVLENRFSRFFGRISYSLYLWHWPIITLMTYGLGRPIGSDITLVIICIMLSVLLGWLSYEYIETPFRKPWAENPVHEKLKVSFVLSFLATILVIPGTLAWMQNGWPWRMNDKMVDAIVAASVKPRANCIYREFPGLDRLRCVFGQQSEKIDIVVIGDSHAATLSAGLAHHIKNKDITGLDLQRSAGLPLINSVVSNHAYVYTNMDMMFDTAFQQKPSHIVLHARFPIFWTSSASRSESHFAKVFVSREGYDVSTDVASSKKHFKIALADTIKEIKERGITPVVVGSVPEPGTDVLRCFSVPIINSFKSALQRCPLYTQNETRARTDPVNSELRAAVEAYGGIFIDPVNLLCENGRENCNVLENNQILYRDDDHLSDYGSKLLAKLVLETIDEHKVAELKK